MYHMMAATQFIHIWNFSGHTSAKNAGCKILLQLVLNVS